MGIAILAQIIRVQFVQGNYWKLKADSLSTDIKSIEASRGSIFSDDGSLLATSVPIYEVHTDLMAEGLEKEIFENNIDSMSLRLSQLFNDKSKEEYKQIASSPLR